MLSFISILFLSIFHSEDIDVIKWNNVSFFCVSFPNMYMTSHSKYANI